MRPYSLWNVQKVEEFDVPWDAAWQAASSRREAQSEHMGLRPPKSGRQGDHKSRCSLCAAVFSPMGCKRGVPWRLHGLEAGVEAKPSDDQQQQKASYEPLGRSALHARSCMQSAGGGGARGGWGWLSVCEVLPPFRTQNCTCHQTVDDATG